MKFLKGVLSVALLASMGFAAEYVIKFSHVVSLNTPKGKIKVEVYPNAQLGKDKVVLRKMKFNAVKMAAPSFSKFTGLVPQLGLFDLPFLFKNKTKTIFIRF